MAYNVETHWSRVAEEIRRRGPGNYVAGDDDPFHRYKRAKFLRRFLSTLNVARSTVLELGCGPGGNLLELARRSPGTLIGVDISTSMLDLAAQTLAQSTVPIQLRKTDGQHIPLDDQTADIAFTVTVLQHNVDPAMLSRIVSELCRVTVRQIVIMEDTGTTLSVGHDATGMARPVDAYRAEFARHGFGLRSATYLNLRVSRWAQRALWGRLVPSSHREGQPLGFVYRALLMSALAITRHLDDASPDTQDLTKMVFTRAE
jgi:SAM-dependent methyltransferase